LSHFLIFIPGASGASPKLLEEAGLADFVEGAEFLSTGHVPELPGGAANGVLCGWRKPGSEPRIWYLPNEQEWRPAIAVDGFAAARFHIGFWKDRPPLPSELGRRYRNPGTSFRLDDGQEWLFPEARELPRTIMLEDDGSWKFEVHRQFHDFWLVVQQWSKDLAAAEVQGDKAETKFAYTKIFEFLCRALRINYRMLPEVASHLRMFNTQNVVAPLLKVVASIGPAPK
jgi:hypothetical protein